MSDLLLPGFEQVRLDGQPKGGPYDDTSNPKLGWHTWEGFSWAGAEAAFRKYPPHLAAFPPWPGKEELVGRRQYVPLNRHAYAFAGSENDDEFVIQVEVAGRAAEMRNMPDVVIEWLATEVVAPIERTVHVPRVVVAHGFRDTINYQGTHPLASAKSAIRLTSAQLREFSGHLGHQHMPAPDHHWDPGALPIDRILAHLTHAEATAAPLEDDMFRDILAMLTVYYGYPNDPSKWTKDQRTAAAWWFDVVSQHGIGNAGKLMASDARKFDRIS